MGLRCLIGHDYGEPQTSRDRTQRGNEVVVTVREYRECTRCGHTRVISENKEVKADAPPATEEPPAAEASWAPSDDREEDQATVDAFARSSAEPPGADHEESMTAAEDDGIILEDDAEAAPTRSRGEWPEADLGGATTDEPADEHEPWPDEQAPPAPEEPEEPEPPEPGEDPLEVGPESTAEGTAGDEDPQTEVTTADAEDAPAEPDTAPSQPDESAQPRPDNRDTEFVCPDCGETWPTRNASLRPGDICPECRRGYLDERVVQ